jgi:hypothetical protein
LKYKIVKYRESYIGKITDWFFDESRWVDSRGIQCDEAYEASWNGCDTIEMAEQATKKAIQKILDYRKREKCVTVKKGRHP